jgi:Tfp pilus assembly protein PilX
MIFNSSKKIIKERGITLYIAVIVASFLILSSIAIVSIAVRQVAISSVSRDSQVAFYAADTGIECALYWDLKNTTVSGQSAFATVTPSGTPVAGPQSINCNNNPTILVGRSTISANPADPLYGIATSTFSVAFVSPDTSCVTVTIVKSYVSGFPVTKIESKGYNYGSVSGLSCISTNARRTERAVRVNY